MNSVSTGLPSRFYSESLSFSFSSLFCLPGVSNPHTPTWEHVNPIEVRPQHLYLMSYLKGYILFCLFILVFFPLWYWDLRYLRQGTNTYSGVTSVKFNFLYLFYAWRVLIAQLTLTIITMGVNSRSMVDTGIVKTAFLVAVSTSQ